MLAVDRNTDNIRFKRCESLMHGIDKSRGPFCGETGLLALGTREQYSHELLSDEDTF